MGRIEDMESSLEQPPAHSTPVERKTNPWVLLGIYSVAMFVDSESLERLI